MLVLFDSSEIIDGEQLTTRRRRPLGRAAAEWLSETDRVIYELADQAIPVRVIARAVSLNYGTVSRRISQVRKRVASPVVQGLLLGDCPVPERSRKIALLHLLSGRSIPRVARTLNMTESVVREHVRYASGIVQGLLRRDAV